MSKQFLKLSELAAKIQQTFLEQFSGTYWIVAEIKSIKTDQRKGHTYLELIEKDEQGRLLASIKAMIWRNDYSNVLGKFQLETGRTLSVGMKVLVQAFVSYHVVYGLSLHIRDIEPSFTIGEDYLRRIQTLRMLKQKGLINKNKSLKLPVVIQRIAVISSETAAGYSDFINQLTRNKMGIVFYHKLFPALMQGEQSAISIVAALNQIQNRIQEFDVVVIVRGGGSATDLSTYDDPQLAIAVADFPLPILTGIGHSTDKSVLDLISHKDLTTPTAVARFLVERAAIFLNALSELILRLESATKNYLASEKLTLQNVAAGLHNSINQKLWREKYTLKNIQSDFRIFVNKIRDENVRLHLLQQKLLNASLNYLNLHRRNLLDYVHELKHQSVKAISEQRHSLEKLQIFIKQNDPMNIIKKGFSLSWSNGKLVKSIADINPGDQLETWVSDGKILSKVQTKKQQK